jgi:predicted DsbA family dithiol-disulfide isomerase
LTGASVDHGDSNVLVSAGPGSPDLVVFLDLESQRCRVALPVIDRVRADYRGRAKVVLRYAFTNGHTNSMDAARALEAASRQGELEGMVHRICETEDWREGRDSQLSRFRGFAEDLGLDIARFQSDLSEPGIRDRMEEDRRDAIALGVQDTPAFFLNGRRIQPVSESGLRQLLDEVIES